MMVMIKTSSSGIKNIKASPTLSLISSSSSLRNDENNLNISLIAVLLAGQVDKQSLQAVHLMYSLQILQPACCNNLSMVDQRNIFTKFLRFGHMMRSVDD